MKIKYSEVTKSFGIISDRVRKTGLEHIKSKYDEGSDKYKDYKERKELLDNLENTPGEEYRPYGYAVTPRRTLEYVHKISPKETYIEDIPGTPYSQYKTRTIVPQGYIPSDKAARSINKDIVNKRDFKGIQNRDAKESERELYKNQFKKVDELNNKYRDELTKFKDGSRVLTPFIEDALRKEGVNVTHNPGSFAGTTDTWLTKSGKLLKAINPQFNMDPIDPDSRGLHERRHLKNTYDSINGSPDQTSGKRNQSHEVMKSHDNKLPEYTVDNVLDYINQVQQEELSANRGAVMDGYVLGGTNGLNAYTKDDGLLDHAYDTAELSQLTYDSLTGGYRPPSNRWNMDKNSYENLIKNKKAKGIVDEVLRPEVTGHIDL